ncbi:MAG: hypothetical protein BAJALOKI3v1_50133 [Promethearchaeota archaeon]|nr:MAG: hypothetical protein BAJALOKI3v1_50133 [Candidatus Lokiarchaeota archaeon]
MVQIGRVTEVKTSRSLINAVQKLAVNTISNRLNKAISDVDSVIQPIVDKTVRRHPIIRSILGQRTPSLAAEFGLRPQHANNAVETIVEMFKRYSTSDVVDVQTPTGSRFLASLTVRVLIDSDAILDELSSLTDTEPFAYDSVNGKSDVRRIRWLDLLLDLDNKQLDKYFPDIETGEFGISFKEELVANADSRSRQAIMTTRRQFAERFPYRIPKDYISTDNNNLIDSIVRNEELRKTMNEAVSKTLIKRLRTPVRKR